MNNLAIIMAGLVLSLAGLALNLWVSGRKQKRLITMATIHLDQPTFLRHEDWDQTEHRLLRSEQNSEADAIWSRFNALSERVARLEGAQPK